MKKFIKENVLSAVIAGVVGIPFAVLVAWLIQDARFASPSSTIQPTEVSSVPTNTFVPPTNTLIPLTDVPTQTPISLTDIPNPTHTPIPPTDMPIPTPTLISSTNTPYPTNTPLPTETPDWNATITQQAAQTIATRPTNTHTPIPIPALQINFSDDFNGNFLKEEWDNSDLSALSTFGGWEINNGRIQPIGIGALKIGDANWNNYSIDVDVIHPTEDIQEGASAQILFALTDSETCGFVDLSIYVDTKDGFGKFVLGQFFFNDDTGKFHGSHLSKPKNGMFSAGEVVPVHLEISGKSIFVRVNNETQSIEFESAREDCWVDLSGPVALFTTRYRRVQFDNFEIKSLLD